MVLPIVITSLLAYGITIFIYSDETLSELNYMPIVELNGQNFGSQACKRKIFLIIPMSSVKYVFLYSIVKHCVT